MSNFANLEREDKFATLEICRFLCAISILFWHYQHFFSTGIWDGSVDATQRQEFPLYSVLAPLYDFGGLAIYVFWCISGFIFFWKYADCIHDKKISPANFFVLRLSRLYPLHLMTLLIVTIMQSYYLSISKNFYIYSIGNINNFFAQLIFASNWRSAQDMTFNGPIWSVSIEVLAYAAFLLLVYFFRPTANLCAAIVVFSLGLLTVLNGTLNDEIFHCIALFFAGGCVQRVIRDANVSNRAILLCIVALSCCLTVAILTLQGYIIGLVVFVLPVQIVFLVVLLERISKFKFSYAARFGKLTYSTYLLHFPLQLITVIAVDCLAYERSIFLSPFALLSFIVATFAVAGLSHKYIELPAQNLIRAWPRRRHPVII